MNMNIYIWLSFLFGGLFMIVWHLAFPRKRVSENPEKIRTRV